MYKRVMYVISFIPKDTIQRLGGLLSQVEFRHNGKRIPEVPNEVRNLGEGRQAGNRESASYSTPLGASERSERRVHCDALQVPFFIRCSCQHPVLRAIRFSYLYLYYLLYI